MPHPFDNKSNQNSLKECKMNDENNENVDNWTAADFHAWLMEEAHHFRKVSEGFHYEFSEETKTIAEWGKLFREWLNDNI
jgi:hypothetical protein